MRRVATAQRDIATAVGVPYPAYLDTIIAHLAPLPVTVGPGGGAVWAAADGKSWVESSIWRHFASVLYPIWPTESVDAFSSDQGTAKLALASAVLYSNLTCGGGFPELPYKTCVDAGWGALTIFSALARVLPAVPGSNCAVGVKSPLANTAATAADGARAESAPPPPPQPAALTAADVADAFEIYIAAYSANSTNFLAYAPGGGVENIGLSQGVNDMLLQSSGGILHLFPAWPRNEPASFATLRAKGAYLVSASWDPAAQTAKDVSITATVFSPKVTLASPFAGAHEAGGDAQSQRQMERETQAQSISLHCSTAGKAGKARTVKMSDAGTFIWSMAANEVCQVEPVHAAY